jgi:hypothetical protein
MIDPMQQQPQLPPSNGDQPFRDQLSMHRPDDISAMTQNGMLSPEMTIRDFFGQFGVDVDGSIMQLAELADKQEANADPMNKMKSLAGGSPPGAQGMPGAGGQAPPSPPPSGNPMDQLMQ